MRMSRQTGLMLLGASVLLAGTVAMSAAKRAAPRDFSVRYEWRNGSVAPPYHYEYTILLGPGTRGRMALRPGYPDPNAKPIEWTESFAFTPASRDKLRATMQARGVFSRSWQGLGSGNRPVGGGSENLQVKAGWRTSSIPAFVAGEKNQDDADAVFAAINALVPKAARARLEARREKYMEQERKKMS